MSIEKIPQRIDWSKATVVTVEVEPEASLELNDRKLIKELNVISKEQKIRTADELVRYLVERTRAYAKFEADLLGKKGRAEHIHAISVVE